MKPYLLCPNCGSDNIVKNGTTHRGKQNHLCRDCGRQFVANPQRQSLHDETIEMLERPLLERISLAGIARVLQVSESWIQQFVNRFYSGIKRSVQVSPKTKSRLTVQMDELWSFVDSKGNQQWVWLALDRVTREIVGCHIGDRSSNSAKALWDSLPRVYRQCAVVFTDHWEAYKSVLPSKRHVSVDKDSGLTSHIERFNNTLRQRVSRLVRKTLSFSKKVDNHIGAIWNFIHEYNRQISYKLPIQIE